MMTGDSPHRLIRPRTILFDWDNTLVDTWQVIHAALNETLDALGRPRWSLAETRARVRHSAREAFPAWFGADAERAAKVFYDAFEARHLDALAPLPGAAALLAELESAGYDLAVISNKQGAYLRAEAAHLGWTGHFRALVGAGDAPRDKPAPEAVARALDGAPAGSPVGSGSGAPVWLVGDTDIDMACAHAAGLHPVLLRPEPPAPLEFGQTPPARHVASCAALAQILRLPAVGF